ncbi:MAG TPA: DUF1778 domain-containing protein [Stellaceae bacterium]|jgi:uncharacterized protein (DUF1778 family)
MQNKPQTRAIPERAARSARKSERLMARLSGEQKRLLQRGAEIRGQTLTEFVVAAAQDAATRAIVEHEVIELGLRDSAAFAEGMLDPPPIGAPLRAAARRYKKAAEF